MKQFLVNISDEDFAQARRDFIGSINDEAVLKNMLDHHGLDTVVREMPALNDITGSEIVEVAIRDDSKVLWVNSEKGCVLRICQIKQFVLDDRRMPVPVNKLAKYQKKRDFSKTPEPKE